ncbi:MAG: RHS repeat domain-containing protein [Bryobacteraceae bacterium]
MTYASGPTSNIHYAAHGAIDRLKLRNGLFEQTSFNPRLQVTGITLGTSLGANDKWGIGNVYATAGYNNGNLLSQTITVPGMGSPAQIFLYDPVNRITLATENPSNAFAPACPDAGSQWCERFGYDNYGNRSMSQSSNTGIVAPVGFNASSNRITDSGWGYDQAGNLNQDLGALASYKYDAENRLVAACANDGPATCTNQAGAGRTLYNYDGEGRRVSKQTPDGVLTGFVYDASGQLAAEYGGVAMSSGTTEYPTRDQLGSTRVVTDGAQAVTARHDFRPFGDEISATGVRQGITGYGLDGAVRQKFTGQERDGETGLDYFGARYFSGAQGRFTSPDQPFIDQFPQNPQSWNLYSYGRNNPLTYTDPTGQAVQVCTSDESGKQTCTVLSDPQYAAAIAGNNPGINAPAAGASAGPGGGLAVGGAITCGGVVCGSATYQEESMQETTGDLVALGQLTASIPSLVRGGASLSQSLIRGVAGLFSKEAEAAAKVTVQDILQGAVREGGSRTDIYSKPGGFAQATQDFESLEGTSQTVGPVRIKDLPNGGGRAVLRNLSSDGRPTLEIQPAGGGYKGTAIRYN